MTGIALTIFLGAFLLFQVQPLMGRYIVPWFGGAPSVWTTCLLFFQVFLLAGYLYAHWLSRWLNLRAQGWLHLGLLGASLALLPITPGPEWKPQPDDGPVGRILLLLLSSVGVPFLLLGSTGPLMQHWLSRSRPGRSPYRLYALSNAASLLALVSYPTLVEPTLTLASQTALWSGTYVLFALSAGWCAASVVAGARRAGGAPAPLPLVSAVDPPAAEPRAPSDLGGQVRPGTIALWLGLAAAGSALLLATTNQLTQEVASVPFLWVLPLCIYLFTFVVCFDRERWYARRVFGPLLALMAMLTVGLLLAGTTARLWTQLVVYSGLLLAGCMCCHGELFRSRPGPRDLTLFYLMVALGGVLGGGFVTLVAPLVFRGFWELHVALWAACALTLAVALADRRTAPQSRWYRGALWVGVAALGVALALQARTDRAESVYTERDFYGLLRVAQREDSVEVLRVLINGRIAHGRQYQGPAERLRPIAYYDSASGVGMVLSYAARRAAMGPPPRSLRVGVVGLGAGTLAAYGRSGDVFRFYEISPAVARVAERYFTYLEDSDAGVEIALGDARIRLEEELRRGQGRGQGFDVLVVDAFTSDAIPIHLLTEECTALYLRHLKDDGLLLFHVSNRFVNLRPVIRGLARRFGLRGMWIVHGGRVRPGVLGSSWMIVGGPGHPIFEAAEVTDSASGFPTAWMTIARAAARLRTSEAAIEQRIRAGDLPSKHGENERLVGVETDPAPVLWTDDRSSLWPLLRFR